MKTECPWCQLYVGCHIPKGGDGSALRLSTHKNMWGTICMGSKMLDVECGKDRASKSVESKQTAAGQESLPVSGTKVE